MIEIKVTMGLLCRMFSTKRYKALAGINRRIKLTAENESIDMEDAEDISELESNFFTLNESHKMHDREMVRKKEHLKQQIVARKYFKENEPRFLTFAERQLIHKLHESNPEEWTVETLSESFPALPEAIEKILHAKWSSKSIENVVRYDNVVVENWKKFREGKLTVNPILKKHLMKFKDRKIILTDRDILAKQFIAPKPEFEKPKSQLFSNIIQTYLNEKQDDTKLLPQKDNQNQTLNVINYPSENNDLLIANIPSNNESVTVNNQDTFLLNNKRHYIPYNKKKNAESLTFNEFVKKQLKTIYNSSPEEAIVLLDVYKKQIAASNQETQTGKVAAISDNTITNVKKDTVSHTVQKSNQDISVVSEDENTDSNVTTLEDGSAETYIKIWNKKVDVELNYTDPIKIKKNLYKPGMTYRISDCYYDDDGEFLYRVPNVQN